MRIREGTDGNIGKFAGRALQQIAGGSMEIEAPGMNNDNDAAQCLANEAQRYGRDQKAAAYYEPMKRRMKRRYAKMKAKREPIVTGVASRPWNDMDGEMVLHVCDSVKALLPKGSEYR